MADLDSVTQASQNSNTMKDNVDNSQVFENNDSHTLISKKYENIHSVPNLNTSNASNDFHSIVSSPEVHVLSNLIKNDQNQVAQRDGHLQISSTTDQTQMNNKGDPTLPKGDIDIKLDVIAGAQGCQMTNELSKETGLKDQSELTINELSSCGEYSLTDSTNDHPLQMIKESPKLTGCCGVNNFDMSPLLIPGSVVCTQRTSLDDFSNVINTDELVQQLNSYDRLEESNTQTEILASNVLEMQNFDENKMVVENRSSKCLDNDKSLQNVDLVVAIKEEPEDSGYEKPELIYRGGAIVVYSDTDSDSNSSFNILSPTPVEESEEELEAPTNHDEAIEHQNERNKKSSKCISRTEGEVFPEELPPLEYLTISPDEGVELEPIGTVSGIVDVLVVVKANANSPALYDDTVLFLEGRRPLGLIFETFGTVERPFYSVRFNNHKDILEQKISVGDRIYFAPKADNLTKYVFISELRKVKFDDASWENDNEPPPTQIEYSDDEEEKRAKQRQRNKSRCSDGNVNGQANGRKKRRKKTYMEEKNESQGPQLLIGDLNRNPFGDRDKMYNPPSSNQWPPKEVRGLPPQQLQQAKLNPPFRGPPPAHFGKTPDWKNQPNIMGRNSSCQNVSYVGNGGSFSTNNNIYEMMVPNSSFCGSYRHPNYSIPPPNPHPSSNPYLIPPPENYNHPRGNYPCFAQFNPLQPPPNIFSQMHPNIPPS